MVPTSGRRLSYRGRFSASHQGSNCSSIRYDHLPLLKRNKTKHWLPYILALHRSIHYLPPHIPDWASSLVLSEHTRGSANNSKMRSTTFAALSLLAPAVLGHGSHDQKPMVADDANWMTRHMAEEHHMTDFDASSFFTLHDYNGNGRWEPDEILRTYGLMDESNKDVPYSKRQELQKRMMQLLDRNSDGLVSRDEFMGFISGGGTLPDLGTGPGHHGDDEYEYEIHHWEKYHDENTKLEDLTHPEDIEHFRKHEEMEDAEERLEQLERMMIVAANIPSKFRRAS
ncbi:hypothetical protein GGR57DRAFT_110795 [Xylariaceae sp. FL1272]|nr:hypothetical protein GGR57DRAFT_110795 [Xylariaceae sp. FL1272]